MNTWRLKIKHLVYFAGCLAFFGLTFNIAYDLNLSLQKNALPELQEIAKANNSQKDNLSASLENDAQDKTTITAFGDLMLDRNVENYIQKSGTDYVFKNLDPNILGVSDIVLANLEGPFTNEKRSPEKGETDFNFNTDYIKILKDGRINLVGLANNHLLDQGSEGAKECRDFLQKNEIDYFGDPNSDSKEYVLIKTINGKKIAFVGLDLFDHNFDSAKTKEIFDAINPYSDYRIAFIHWGTEYASQPQDKQKEIAHQIIDLGADIILGHHPHVAQSIEVYNNKPIFYSLGNFVFDQYFSKETQQGLAVQIKLLPYQVQYELLPINIVKSQPQFMQEDDKVKFLNYLIKISDLDEKISNQLKDGYLSLEF